MEFLEKINELYGYLAFLAPYKWLIILGSAILGVGCIVLCFKAKNKSHNEED